MEIIITKHDSWHYGKTFHAFFIGDKGAVCVPADYDGLNEYSPTDFQIKDIQKEINTAKEMLKANCVCKQLSRILAYCEAKNIKKETAN